MYKKKVLALQLVPYLCVFYCDVVELGSYGKLKYYDTMTEEGKNDFRIVCIGFFFIYGVCCLPISKSLLSSLHDLSDIVWFIILSAFLSSFCHHVYLELETCNTMGDHVIPFERSKPSQLCNILKEMVSAVQTQAHMYCVSIRSSTCSQQHIETHPSNTRIICP